MLVSSQWSAAAVSPPAAETPPPDVPACLPACLPARLQQLWRRAGKLPAADEQREARRHCGRGGVTRQVQARRAVHLPSEPAGVLALQRMGRRCAGGCTQSLQVRRGRCPSSRRACSLALHGWGGLGTRRSSSCIAGMLHRWRCDHEPAPPVSSVASLPAPGAGALPAHAPGRPLWAEGPGGGRD